MTSRTSMARTIAVVAGLLLAACSDGGSDGSATPSTTTVAGEEGSSTTTSAPEDLPAAAPDDEHVPTGDWEVVTPDRVSMDPDVLEAARDYAFADDLHTQGVVVVRHGVIAAEWYADGADESSWAASWSVAKSFASALVGIAIGQGLIQSVDQPMTTWFPDWAGTERESMTLRHVLEMGSGIEWNEDYDPAGGVSDIIAMVTTSKDHLGYVNGLPSEVPPGSRWAYSSGDSMLLSEVVAQATGMSAGEYARQVLFDPLGMDQAEWWADPTGHTLTYCCLDTTSRGFARFGLLYLRGGDWNGDQVVPADWVKASLEPSAHEPGYGLQWWLGNGDNDDLPEDMFRAQGFDGQWIYVIPSLDLVVVRNGTYVKSPLEPVADPSLFSRYPPSGIIADQGTRPPEQRWDHEAFLGPIIDSIES